ncbi:PAS domain-containing protein, partial [bacterium]|nr:PAS domain-containing protein [bacterium]
MIKTNNKYEDKYKDLFNNMRSGVAIYEVKNKGNEFYFKDFNKAAEIIEGLKIKNVLGKEVRELFPGAIDMGIIKIFKKVYKTGKSVYFPEAKIVNKKGEVKYRSNFIYRIENNYIVAIFNDITEYVKKTQELEEIKRKIEKIIDFVPSAIFTVDKNKKILTWNKEAENIVGYKAEEMIGKKCTDFAAWPCSDKCGLYSDDVKKPIKNKECTIKNKKGKTVWISKNVDYLRDVFGKIIGGIESFVDISNEREKEIEIE